MNVILSKSKYLSGLQCPKLLWHLYNAKDEIPEPDEAQQAIFDQGHMVGELAKKLFPNGIDIPFSKTDTVKHSLEALKKRVPIFEASLTCANCYCRADILEPTGKDSWNLIEVKSTTSLKDEHLYDIGFQYHVYTKAGLKIDKCYLMHLNNKYVRKGDIDLNKLFIKADVTSDIKASYHKIVSKNVAAMVGVISADDFPETAIGRHCIDPYDCPLQEKCWAFLPERNVFLLYNSKKIPFALVEDGIYELTAIPDGIKLNAKHKIQIECERTSSPHIDPPKIKKFLDSIEYPAYYMDFETCQSAVPMFDGVKPYQQIPFQFSVHIVDSLGAKPRHYSFLADGEGDPRPKFMAELKDVMGRNGSILVFNATFETGILKECAKVYPEYTKWVESVSERMKDLLKPFKDFVYYHPRQDGSCSLKKVLPVLTGRSYAQMEIGDGGTASREYFRVTFTEDNKDKQKVRDLLEAYCGLDTLGMVEIVERLENNVDLAALKFGK